MSFARKYKKQLLDTGLHAVKTASKKVVHRADELIGNKTADAVTKSNYDKIVKQKPVEQIVILPEKKKKKYWTNWDKYYYKNGTL